MSEENNTIINVPIRTYEESIRLTERLLEVTEPGVVFSKPTKSGEYTLITASEIMVGLGSGYGYGISEPGERSETETAKPMPPAGSGGGGGGGGMSSGRPVAVVSIGPEGVQVHPVLDRTKLGIAMLSAVGSMMFAIGRMQKGR